MGFVEHSDYWIAWLVYGVAGLGCCAFWWKVTSLIKHSGWRDLLRGLTVVLLFTPWYAGDSPEFYAPAFVVLLLDLMLEGAKSGMKGGVALLVATFIMLLVITIRQYLRAKPRVV
ncbi:MAG: hypothetical protein ACJAYE_002680 [Candidatus Azotimanducaceae bacterium]|jgi:hypothetical protein